MDWNISLAFMILILFYFIVLSLCPGFFVGGGCFLLMASLETDITNLIATPIPNISRSMTHVFPLQYVVTTSPSVYIRNKKSPNNRDIV
jgi:hypothetical protein